MSNINSDKDYDRIVEAMVKAAGADTAPRVTQDEINAAFGRVKYVVNHRPGGSNSTFVHAYLDGAFYLGSGHSACVSAENFRPEIGERIARGKAETVARDKLWELFGFALYQAVQPPADDFLAGVKACDLSGEGTCEACQ